MAAHNFIDITGVRFGKLVVIKLKEKKGKVLYWECLCDCGNTSIVYGGGLKGGKSKSCGCKRIKFSLNTPSKKHGMSESRIYNIWCCMMARCYNETKKDTLYKNWGGRGVLVCDRWKNFDNFLLDMKDGYKDDLSLDRYPDKNGNYEPINCRWATRVEQNRNMRSNRILEFNGEKRILVEWSELTGIGVTTIRARLKYGWSIKDTLTKPSIRKNKLLISNH